MKRIVPAALAAVALVFVYPAWARSEPGADSLKPDMTKDSLPAITITCAAFEDGGMIPKKYTCDSVNVSPPLAWSGVPDSATTLALICDDPDAPGRTWVHWVIYNIPPDTSSFGEGVPKDTVLANGAIQGTTDFNSVGYGGPCPPSGTHRYFFKLYALDFRPEFEGPVTKEVLVKSMAGHVLAQGVLMGRYARAR